MRKYILALTSVFVFLVFPATNIPANASSTQSIGNLTGKWTIPKVVKLPKGNCSTFNATFKLGPKSLKPGTNATSFGFSSFGLYTPMKEPMASQVVSWSEYLIESNGSASQSFKVKFCKSDWQNSDGDFLAGVTKGKVEVAIVQNNDLIKASLTFVK
jgi:hypothetical protein